MSADNVLDNFVAEMLRKIQAGITRLEAGQVDIAARLGRLEVAMIGVRRSALLTDEALAHSQIYIDRIHGRLDRIERRLELVDDSVKEP